MNDNFPSPAVMHWIAQDAYVHALDAYVHALDAYVHALDAFFHALNAYLRAFLHTTAPLRKYV